MQRSRLATHLLAALLVLVTLGYGLFEARALIMGPQVTLIEPRQHDVVEGVVYTVRGKATGVARVRLNGRTVTLDARGGFEETLLVPKGSATLVLDAENRFGRRVQNRVTIFGKPSTPDMATTTATTTTHATATAQEALPR